MSFRGISSGTTLTYDPFPFANTPSFEIADCTALAAV
jgi:hypothetical protein